MQTEFLLRLPAPHKKLRRSGLDMSTLHQCLVLCPSYVPEKVGINKKKCASK
jgi:hypothetical protein